MAPFLPVVSQWLVEAVARLTVSPPPHLPAVVVIRLRVRLHRLAVRPLLPLEVRPLLPLVVLPLADSLVAVAVVVDSLAVAVDSLEAAAAAEVSPAVAAVAAAEADSLWNVWI